MIKMIVGENCLAHNLQRFDLCKFIVAIKNSATNNLLFFLSVALSCPEKSIFKMFDQYLGIKIRIPDFNSSRH